MRRLLFAAILLVASPALAEDVAGARTAFEKGAALANEGRWSDALAQFEASAALRPHATTSYNIGFCERALGHPTRARKFFAQALARDAATAGSELTTELRNATKKFFEEATTQVAMPEITVVPADVIITVDGRPLEVADTAPDGERMLAGTRPAGPGEKLQKPTFILEVDAGSHEIVIAGPDGRTKVAHEYFPPQSAKKVRLELPPPAPPPRVIIEPNTSRRTWGFVIGGVGLAAVGVGSYFGLRASSTWNQAKDACPGLTGCPDNRGNELASDARTFANLSTIAFTAGAVALVGGTILVLTSPSPRSQVSVGLASVSFSASF